MNKQEIITALEIDDFSHIRKLADDIRIENHGDIVHIRAILEYTNYCRRKCSYCGLNCLNNKLERYRLDDDVIIDLSYRAWDAGYKTLVLQGGEDPHYDAERLGRLVGEISRCGMVITLSSGEMSHEDYSYLRSCGASRYLLKHETANPHIYSSIHPDSTLERRLANIRDIKSLGYDTGSGFMVGLPGQTTADLADDLLLLKELGCDMAGIGTYIPHPDTPMADSYIGSVELTRRCVAIARIMMPKLHLPATTSLHVASGSQSGGVFDYGANVIMRKITPTRERLLYDIYPSNKVEFDMLGERRAVEELIVSEGKRPL